jgi:hypothetical protein
MRTPLVIETGTRRVGTCRSCGASIEWAVVRPSGKAMPFNRPIVLLPALHMDDALGTARVDPEQTTSHFATCPQAAQWRRQRVAATR